MGERYPFIDGAAAEGAAADATELDGLPENNEGFPRYAEPS
jgi:hypothetical protein